MIRRFAVGCGHTPLILLNNVSIIRFFRRIEKWSEIWMLKEK